jgi:hypothetical protein
MSGIDGFTKLLLHGNKVDGSISHALTFAGTAQLDTAQYKLGTSSLLLDGNSDYLTTPDHADWYFGSGDFTIDFWVRFNVLPSTGQNQVIVSQYQNGTNQWLFYLNNTSGTYSWIIGHYPNNATSDINISKNSPGLSINIWYHIALVRNGNNWLIFQNGTQCGTTVVNANDIHNFSGTLRIGTNDELGNYLNGWLDELRISKDIARWTTNFTPETRKYISDQYTGLLCHFNGADAATTTDDCSGGDESLNNKIITYVNAVTDTAQSKFANSSILFDGTGDYLTIPDSADWYFSTGDFTIDFWVRFNALPGSGLNEIIFYHYQNATNNWLFYTNNISGTYKWTFLHYPNNASYDIEISKNSPGLVVNTWYHIALVRNGNNWLIFQDGTQCGTTDINANDVHDFTGNLIVGGTASNYFNGWLDELRISKGIARWTTNFTPPTEEYTESITQTITSDAEIAGTVQETINSDAEIINYEGKFIHNGKLFLVTDTSPAKIIKVDLGVSPPTHTVYTLNDSGEVLDNGKDLVINHTTEELYASFAAGDVAKFDLADPDTKTIYNVGESVQLYSIAHNPDYLTTFIADAVADESLFTLDEATYEKINTDFRTRAEEESQISTILNTTFGVKINTDFRTRVEAESKINTDLRFALHEYDEATLYPLARTDFHVKIDTVELTDNDLKLDSIKITHTADNKSTTSFILTRKHDNLDNPVEITNNNVVTIYLGTKLEFTGKIQHLSCNSESETVEVSAESDNINEDYNIVTKELPLTTINTQLHLYDVLINDVSIDNPYINGNLIIVGKNEKYWTGTAWTSDLTSALTFTVYATAEAYITANEGNDAFYSKEPVVRNYEDNPKYYKGIRVDLGDQEIEHAIRYDLIVADKAKLEDGSFKFVPNYTYFWIVDVQRFDIAGLIGISGNVFYNKYIGTSLAPLSADLYNIVGAQYKQQLILDNEIIDLGYYTIGAAPFKDVSLKNGKYIAFPKWTDKENGLYLELGTSYDYEQYCKDAAAVEYERIKNINGDLLPKTTAFLDLTIDGYLYYALKLLTRINVTNTTTSNIYKNDNGFPLSIKQITIDSGSMKVSLSCDNLRSEYEEELLDQTYPEEPAEDPGFSSLYYWKFDLPNEEDIDA